METKESIKPKVDEAKKESKKPQLKRLIYMLLYAIIGKFIGIVVFFIAIVQFIYTLISKKPNEKLIAFTQKFAMYAKEIIEYLSYNSEEKPWPIGDYPQK